MSVQSEINRISENISDAYDAVETKGGTLPTTLNSDNLANSILSISGSSTWGSITGDIEDQTDLQTALSSKLNSLQVTHETWTFTLDDDTTVTKEVVLWTSV